MTWNPWHGCHKLSEGCQHCYVYRMDKRHGRNSFEVKKTKNFNLPLQRNRKGEWKIPSGETVYTCFTSDFFLEDADLWRSRAWEIMRKRSDLSFFLITKRIHRFMDTIPKDWGDGYPNVAICCTVENQDRADYRLPIYLSVPIQHKKIICEPLLEAIDLSPYLDHSIEEVIVGGESGMDARICNYEWVLSIRQQCVERDISFTFHQTGAYLRKDGRIYFIKKALQHQQAQKAGISYLSKTKKKE